MKKWIFRILLTLIILIGSMLFALKIVSGTSDTQKHGLEQAFSSVFRGKARFGELTSFNLFPHFTLGIKDMRIDGIGEGKIIKADLLNVGFGSGDLMLKNRLVEAFTIKNLSLDKDLYLSRPLLIESASINAGDTKEAASFTFSGIYDERKIMGVVAMKAFPTIPPKYTFSPEGNDFTVNAGAAQIKGIFTPYDEHGHIFSGMTLLAKDGKREKICTIDDVRVFGFKTFFEEVVPAAMTMKSAQTLDYTCKKIGGI